MIKKTITGILNALDFGLKNAEEQERIRDKNLDTFLEIVYEDVKRIVDEVVSADKRLSTEERNQGFFILFDQENLFRVAVLRLSDRVEVKVNSKRVTVYYGNGIDFSKYDKSCKISFAIRNAVLSAFGEEIVAIAKRKSGLF